MRMLLVGLLLSTPAMAADPTNAELAARIAGLEARMAQLEGRTAGPPQTPTGPQALNLDNWRQCRKGMSKAQVRALLGKPSTEQFVSAVNQYPDMETWFYGTPGVGPGGSVQIMGGVVAQCITVGFKS